MLICIKKRISWRKAKMCIATFSSTAAILQSEKVILSGIQPTGIPHIGNYLGAIKKWKNLQNEPGQIYYSVVDLHSMTTPKEKSTLQNNIFDMTACLLACGINPERSVLFQQSNIPEHTALSWIIGCLVTVNRLKHLPQWQVRMTQSNDVGYLGTFSYPVLQTADIILYKATHVPVGDDQFAHMRLTGEIIAAINKKLETNFFPTVNYFRTGPSGRIRSLRDPSAKMSKSALNVKSRVELTDSDEEIWSKIRGSVTDCTSEVTYDPANRPGVSNLVEIHCGFAGITSDQACKEAVGLDTGMYKRTVADIVIESLKPIREEFFRLRSDESYLESTLIEGSDQAREVASKNWRDIQQLLGMRR